MRSVSASPVTASVIQLIERLQARLTLRLDDIIAARVVDGAPLKRVEWLRRGGASGGGVRFETAGTSVFNRASVNMSHVHYADEQGPQRSATALSSIIHPQLPVAPSLHLHISFTETRGAPGTWRLMADLNPSIENAAHTARFRTAIVDVLTRFGGAELAASAVAQGDRYFFIPALQRHRGVFHTYVENHHTSDTHKDLELARVFGNVAIDTYTNIVAETLASSTDTMSIDEQRKAQLAYHTTYLFQVLTLDRGTTSGLLVHDENDVGTMGSLPGFVDRDLLASWAPLVPPVQRSLVEQLVAVLPAEVPTPVDSATRLALAQVVRAHYTKHPEALDLQARGDVVSPSPLRA
jgi:coproporphyrinogen III oxidase